MFRDDCVIKISITLKSTHRFNTTPNKMMLKMTSSTNYFGLHRWQRIRLPMQKMWVRSLDWEDPLEMEMATHSSILAWEIPWTDETVGLQSMGSIESDAT